MKSASAFAKPVTALFMLSRVDCVDGVAGYLETIISGLSNTGDRVVIVSGPVTTSDGSEQRRDAIRANALEWLILDDFKVRIPRAMQVRQIVALIRRHDVALLVPQGFTMLPYAKLLSRLTGRPIVAHYHPSAHGNTVDRLQNRQTLKARISYRATTTLFGAKRYIAASQEIRRFFINDCRIPSRSIVDQVFGIDDHLFRAPSAEERQQARASLVLSPETLVCVLPGRLNLVKGHDVAVDAVRAIRHRRPALDIVCLFAGGGDQRDEIEAYALRDDADRQTFRFLGFIPTSLEMRSIYWASDIALLPSRFEGFAIAVVEAMACGAAPIRTPTGGHQDQITDGVDGFIVPVDDSQALADRIERLTDPALRARVQTAAISTATIRFTKTAMVEGTRKLFNVVAFGETG